MLSIERRGAAFYLSCVSQLNDQTRINPTELRRHLGGLSHHQASRPGTGIRVSRLLLTSQAYGQRNAHRPAPTLVFSGSWLPIQCNLQLPGLRLSWGLRKRQWNPASSLEGIKDNLSLLQQNLATLAVALAVAVRGLSRGRL